MNEIILDPTENPADEAFVPFAPRPHMPHQAHRCFRKEIDADGICRLTFDTPGEPANVWNPETLDELDCHIEDLHHDGSVRALIIRSAKDRIFIAGADLKGVHKLPPERIRDWLALGQDVFTHLATLRIPKIAAIHGACLGGGFEMTLVCDWRIASDSEVTRIGLPETQLGLIPAWGGCTRLPRLVGLPRALDLIVRGRILKAREAKRAGLVHEVVAPEHLDALARRLALQTAPRRRRTPHLTQLWPVPPLLRIKARAALRAKLPWCRPGVLPVTPAPLAAIEVATRGATRTLRRSLALEQEAIANLVASPMTHRFIGAFLEKDAASRKLPAELTAAPTHPVSRAAVIGAGIMGAGIACALATRGVRVLLTDTSPEALALGLGRIQGFLQDGVKRRSLSRGEAREARDRIATAHEAVPLRRMDLVIEAVVEDLEVKKRLLAELATRVEPGAILASNTSALSLSEMASCVPHPERVVGLHFFNPAHRMPLVEVVTHSATSDTAAATAVRLVQAIGKTPVLVRDRPGFVVNRILFPYLMSAVRLAETTRDPWRIDEAMLEYGMPMGPLRLLDEIGFDVALHVAGTMGRAFPGRLPQSTLLARLAEAGLLGRKSGGGFYLHDKPEPRPNPGILRHLAPALQHRPAPEITTELVGHLREEARRCRDEKVAASAEAISLAMMLGTGFPPFRDLFHDDPRPGPDPVPPPPPPPSP